MGLKHNDDSPVRVCGPNRIKGRADLSWMMSVIIHYVSDAIHCPHSSEHLLPAPGAKKTLQPLYHLIWLKIEEQSGGGCAKRI